jgi:WhiB family redox-sensing transcriptional regulator
MWRAVDNTPTCDDIANRATKESCDTVLNNFWRGCSVLTNASPPVDITGRPCSQLLPEPEPPPRHRPGSTEEELMAEISRLPGPVMDLWEWQFDGACRDADQDLFFHPEGERGSARRRRAEAAKAICATCPVIKQCLEQSLTVREPYGVWGGLSEDERSAVLAQRGRATRVG